jgi:hypothetical protein
MQSGKRAGDLDRVLRSIERRPSGGPSEQKMYRVYGRAPALRQQSRQTPIAAVLVVGRRCRGSYATTAGTASWFGELHLCRNSIGVEDLMIALRLAIVITSPPSGCWRFVNLTDISAAYCFWN